MAVVDMDMGPPAGGDMGGMDMPMGDEPAEFTPADDFEREAQSFLDDSLPMADRIASLREAIRICGEADEGGEYDEKSKPGGDLALIFGSGPSKKKG